MLTRHFQNIAAQFDWPTIMAANSDVHLGKHVQLTLPFIGIENCGHVKMGLFYELMTIALFGGRLAESIKYNSNGFKGTVKPDVIDSANLRAFESKAVKSGRHLNLLDSQMENYVGFQQNNPKYQIYFVMWRHGIKNIHFKKIAEKELYQRIARKTYAVIIMPFSIMHHIWKKPVDGISKHYDIPTHKLTSLKSKPLNDFIISPETQLVKINFKHDVDIYRCVSGPDIAVENFKIEPFLITMLIDNEYELFVKEVTQDPPSILDGWDDEVPF